MGETSLFYTKNSGKVQVIQFSDKPIFPIVVSPVVKGEELGNNKNISAFITQTNISSQVQISTTPSLGTDIFVYILSETMMPITVQGFGFFPSLCRQKRNAKAVDGLRELLDFYDNNNVGVTGKPCRILISNDVFRAQLLSVNIVLKTDFEALFPFSMTFQSIRSKGVK